MQPTYYEILEISQSATSQEIIQAYHKLRRIWDQDKAKEWLSFVTPETLAICLAINLRIESAYKVLLNPNQRKQYDERLKLYQQGVIPQSKESVAFGLRWQEFRNQYSNYLIKEQDKTIIFLRQAMAKQEKLISGHAGQIATLQRELAATKRDLTTVREQNTKQAEKELLNLNSKSTFFQPTLPTPISSPEDLKSLLSGLQVVYKVEDKLSYSSDYSWCGVKLVFSDVDQARRFKDHFNRHFAGKSSGLVLLNADSPLHILKVSSVPNSKLAAEIDKNPLNAGSLIMRELSEIVDISQVNSQPYRNTQFDTKCIHS